MTVFLVILLGLVILLITLWYVEYFKLKKYVKKYNGPSVLPLSGNAHQCASVREIIPVSMKWFEEYGSTIKIMLAHQGRLLIADSKVAEFLLGSPTLIKKSYEYKFFHPWLGTGLLTSSGEKWRRQRKLLTPAFHFKMLEQFMHILNAQSKILIEKLRPNVDGESIDIYQYIALYTLDVICEAAMGTKVNAQNDSESDYVCSVKEICRIIMVRFLSPIKMFDPLFKFTKDYQKQKRALSILHEYTNSVILKRRKLLDIKKETNINAVEEDDVGTKRKLAFLDLLLQSSVNGSPLSNESIREEVDTFMFEGHDTTSTGIAFTLLCLSQNGDIQEKAMEELRTIFGDEKDRPPTYKDLQEMKYLEMVIKEALRLYPPVPFFSRVLEENVEFDGTILPKGIALTIHAYGLHRQKDVYPNPERFDPERFSLENSAGRSPYAYVPFSAGPRNCIGQRFAMMELKSSVSTILRNFKLLPAPNYEPILKADVILKSTSGIKVCLVKRCV